jgi:hypothetical protein
MNRSSRKRCRSCVDDEVCSKFSERQKKKLKKTLDTAGVVRDTALESGVWAARITRLGPKLRCAITFAMTQPAQAPTDRQRHLSNQLIIAAVGMVLSVIVHFTLPKSPGQSFFESLSHLQGNGPQFVWMHFIVSYYMQVAVFLGMVLFAVYSRGPRAWIFAFLSGGAVPELFIFHWLK